MCQNSRLNRAAFAGSSSDLHRHLGGGTSADVWEGASWCEVVSSVKNGRSEEDEKTGRVAFPIPTESISEEDEDGGKEII